MKWQRWRKIASNISALLSMLVCIASVGLFIYTFRTEGKYSSISNNDAEDSQKNYFYHYRDIMILSGRGGIAFCIFWQQGMNPEPLNWFSMGGGNFSGVADDAGYSYGFLFTSDNFEIFMDPFEGSGFRHLSKTQYPLLAPDKFAFKCMWNFAGFQWVSGSQAISFQNTGANQPGLDSWRIRTLTIPLAFPAILTAILPTLWLIRKFRSMRIPAGHCKKCGYDLRASKERCPECGLVILETKSAA